MGRFSHIAMGRFSHIAIGRFSHIAIGRCLTGGGEISYAWS